MRPFHGVLGEDDSDAESIAVLVRRFRKIAGLSNIRIMEKGYGGCAGLLRKGAAQLRAWEIAGCTRAYVCYDADNDPNQTASIRLEIINKLVRDSNVRIPVCCVVPIEELEAWYHGDIAQMGELFHWCKDLKQHSSPQSIHNPKERLISLSRHPQTGKEHYHPPTHNPLMADLIRIEQVEQLCTSFVPFSIFARQG